jgi:hypothetical protein
VAKAAARSKKAPSRRPWSKDDLRLLKGMARLELAWEGAPSPGSISMQQCQNMAKAKGRKSLAQSHPGRQIPRRCADHRNAGTTRRMIRPVTQIQA